MPPANLPIENPPSYLRHAAAPPAKSRAGLTFAAGILAIVGIALLWYVSYGIPTSLSDLFQKPLTGEIVYIESEQISTVSHYSFASSTSAPYLPPTPDAVVSAAAISADGRFVAETLQQGISRVLVLVNLASGSTTEIAKGVGGNIYPVFSRDGSQLAYAVLTTASSSTSVLLPPEHQNSDAGYGPSLQLHANVNVVKLSDKKIVPLVSRTAGIPLGFSPDGKYLVVVNLGTRSNSPRFAVIDMTSGQRWALGGALASEMGEHAALSFDGLHIAYTDGVNLTIGILDWTNKSISSKATVVLPAPATSVTCSASGDVAVLSAGRVIGYHVDGSQTTRTGSSPMPHAQTPLLLWVQP